MCLLPLQWTPFAKNYDILLGLPAEKVYQLSCSLFDGFTSVSLFVSGRCTIEPEHQVSSEGGSKSVFLFMFLNTYLTP